MEAALADVLTSLMLVFSGLVAGIVLTEHAIILPLVRSRAPGEGAAHLRFAGARAWRVAPTCGVIAGLSGAALLALWPWHGFPAAAAVTVVGFALYVVAVLLTFTWYYPIDVRVRRLAAEATRAEADPSFAALALSHVVRASFYAAAFVCLVVGRVIA